MIPKDVKNQLKYIQNELSIIHNDMFTLDPIFNNCTNGLGTVKVYLSKVIQELGYHIRNEELKTAKKIVKRG